MMQAASMAGYRYVHRRWVYRAVSLVACSLLLLGAAACSRDGEAGASTDAARRRPNFLLYVTDTLRADALGCYGNATVETPTLDALAAKGVLFEKAIAPSSWTRASMASILTGLYPTAHKTAERLDQLPDVPRMTELLRERGYRTANFTTNRNTEEVFGFRPGFDFFEQFGEPGEVSRVKIAENTVQSEQLHEAIIAWLDGLERDVPFFIVALAIDPHTPYAPPAEFDRYGDPNYQGRLAADLPSRQAQRIINNANVSPDDQARTRSLYHGEVAHNDHTLGTLVRHLDTIGRADNTIVVFTSDHGEEFWEHGIRGHGKTLFVQAIHVPLIWYDPARVGGGRRLSNPVSTIDIIPTILAEAGITPPAALQGRNLFAEPDGTRAVFSELTLDGSRIWAAYLHPWKLIWNEGTGQESLFNMSSDPQQQQNLASAEPGERTRLRAILDRHLSASRKLGNDISSGRVVLNESDIPEATRRQLADIGYAGWDDEEEDDDASEDSAGDGAAGASLVGEQESRR
ncbi:MAG: sulfatase [Planctomycetes bacterium]|nr:sulfatase [Planctomycetota bacterium]